MLGENYCRAVSKIWMYFLHVLLSVTLLFQWYLEEIVAHRDLLAVSAVVYNCIPLNPSPSCLAPTHKERDVLLTIGKFSVLKFFHYVSFLWNALNFKLNWCSHLESGICEHQKVIITETIGKYATKINVC